MARGAFDLSGKVAVVTGSSRGIGRSIAEHLAAAGAKVVISSRKAPACEEVVQAIRKCGGEAVAIPANIGDKSQLEQLVEQTRRHYGRIDVLVCNAASNPYYGPMAGLPDDAFTKILHNNVVANHWLANLVLPEMAQRRDGVVIIVSSIGGLKGTGTLGAYAISKAADMQLARNLAVEWGRHNIRVNCIAPGLVRTDFARALWENPEVLRRYESRTPLGRIGEPDDIGGIAVFLASRAGAFVTGQSIVADGGVTIAG
ncbi:MAG TPA: SDR family oxidoreductase [Burkholderiales bacterium]|nr:SDR family oxidoreductase [Burkholderiales bacterium]